ncbi:hypothetical protein B0T20DRAFT_411910 [Sordaria brevicollis]|uniref:DUF7924 domain-containing protein n=1 Tax=Sordaria brevicollis TaxID=83679 RepID=A0AAE0PEX2_SORBR|nr:hypothetical protein B0T20DRAFT_411910 [Sordaria brevicollis]
MVRTRAQTSQPLTSQQPQGIRKSTPRKRGRRREKTLEPSPDPDPDPTGQEHTPQEQAGSDQVESTRGSLNQENREVSVECKDRKSLPAGTDPLEHTSDEHHRKRRRTSLEQQDPPHHSLRSAGNSPPLSTASAHHLEPPALPASPAPVQVPEEAASSNTKDQRYIIDYWRREGSWPKTYFKQDDYTRKHFEKEPEEDRWLKEMDPATRLLFDRYDPAARLLFVKRKVPAILNRKRSRSNSSTSTSMPPPSITMTPSDQRPREEKSAPYRGAQYPSVLRVMGSYMEKSPLGISDKSRSLCKTLLNTQQPAPKNSLFDDDIFEKVCDKLLNRNEARVVLDLLRLIVPSAEQHALRARHLEHLDLVESVNEGWNNSCPLTGIIRPQPDYSAGFGREAFTKEQMDKLGPFIGDSLPGDQSFFMATYYMYFPFLTCEAKCGSAALEIADRQNAHSMTLAVRAIVELFRLVKREDEVNRQILAFSISYNQNFVCIYGHYPVINGKDTKYYRHPIHEFSFTSLEGKEKWTAYRFVKNVYDIWAPDHFKNICSAIDQLLAPDISDSSLSEATGLSQNLGNLMQLEQLPTAAPTHGSQSLDMPIPVGNV